MWELLKKKDVYKISGVREERFLPTKRAKKKICRVGAILSCSLKI